MMHSCIYQGRVGHRRFGPRRHAFDYGLFMMYLDLAELEQAFGGRWLWSARRPALAWFRRRDHLGDPSRPLDVCVRDLVQEETGRRPLGPIRLLTQLRYFGYCFNPISIYYCFDPDDTHVEALVAEVTNTPWGERRCYVLEGPANRVQFAKQLHVSPFMPMDLDYIWRCNQPGERLAVHMDVLRGSEKLFSATLGLSRRALTAATLAGMLLHYPFMTLKIITAIYWQALRLWWKGVPIYTHPAHPKSENRSSLTPVHEPGCHQQQAGCLRSECVQDSTPERR